MLLTSYIQSMLTTIASILIILWAIGFLGFHVLGSFIHLLLVIAVVLILLRVIRGENPFS
jgi:asparagine N-glycosylation enzyme membrane subunit Stt3